MEIPKFYALSKDIEIPSVSREQMIEIDRIAIEETGPNLWQMMENGGRNLASLTFEIAGSDLKTKEIVVLAGKGNNGGGGICAARHLINHGAEVKLVVADKENMGEIPTFQLKVFENAGGLIYPFKENMKLNPSIIIDALVGYNLIGSPRGAIKDIIEWANESMTNLISLDIPSGVDSNTGDTFGKYIKANTTLTLALPKRGMYPEKTGELFLGDIGIPKLVFNRLGLNYTSPFQGNHIIQLSYS